MASSGYGLSSAFEPLNLNSLSLLGLEQIGTPPLSLCAMVESFMTTQAAHGQLLVELLTEVASLRADFMKYRSAFPPSQPFDD